MRSYDGDNFVHSLTFVKEQLAHRIDTEAPLTLGTAAVVSDNQDIFEDRCKKQQPFI